MGIRDLIVLGYGEYVGVVEDTLGTHPWIPALVSQCTEEGYIEK